MSQNLKNILGKSQDSSFRIHFLGLCNESEQNLKSISALILGKIWTMEAPARKLFFLKKETCRLQVSRHFSPKAASTIKPNLH